MQTEQSSSPPQPSSSKKCLGEHPNDDEGDELTLNVKDEEAEIARLELPSTTEDDSAARDQTSVDDERIAKIEFHCTACNMLEMVHYFGKTPPFVHGVQLLEDTFVMRDPFQPPPPRWKPKAEYFVALGANCSQCQRTVCRDLECSFYYTRTYCLRCAAQHVKSFPLEVQAKLRRQLDAK